MGLLFLFGSLESAQAGPWIRPFGEWYAKASYNTFDSASYVEPGGASSESSRPSFHGRTASTYLELGVLPGVQLTSELSYQWSHNRFPGGSLRYAIPGPGSARIALGFTHPDLRAPVSLTITSRLPMFRSLRPLFPAPAPGEGQVDLDAIAAAGGSHAGLLGSYWGLAELGLRARTAWVLAPDSPTDEGIAALYRAQIGWRPEFGWLQAESSGIVSLDSPRQSHQLGIGLAVVLWRGLQAEAGLSTIWRAREEVTGRGFNVGLSHTGALPSRRIRR